MIDANSVCRPDSLAVIPNAPGVYLLLLSLPARVEAQIGRLRWIDFAPGPGGLAARLKCHAAGMGRQHWHIDYLLPHARLLGALAREDRQRLECAWTAWAGARVQACIRGPVAG